MKTSLTIQPLAETEYAAWADLVAASPDGSPYATADYLDALCTSAGGTFRILGARRGEELVGGVPLYESPTHGGIGVGPRLLLYYLGPVLRRFDSKYPSQQTARTIEILGGLAETIESASYAKVLLKGRHTLTDLRPFITRGWSARPSYSYVIPLVDLPAQRARIEQNLRRLIDRCTEGGITLTEDDDFEGFLRLHAMTMEHHGADRYLPDPMFRRWFELTRARGLVHLMHARLPDGTSIAAQLVLVSRNPVTHMVSAATDPAHRKLGASAFLRWTAFEWLAGKGFAGVDLTDAALNPVTHFKSQLGGDLVTSIIVESPGSWRWKAGQGMHDSYRRLRGMAGAVVRRLRPKRPE